MNYIETEICIKYSAMSLSVRSSKIFLLTFLFAYTNLDSTTLNGVMKFQWEKWQEIQFILTHDITKSW